MLLRAGPLAERARRCRCAGVRAAEAPPAEAPPAAPARRMTRKRALVAQLRLGAQPAPPPAVAEEAPVENRQRRRAGRPPPRREPEAFAAGGGDDDVLDLSSLVAPSFEAPSFEALETESSLSASHDAPLDLEALPEVGAHEEGTDTWSYDSATDEMVFKRVARPAGGRSPPPDLDVSALLARMEAQDAAAEFDDDEDGEDSEEVEVVEDGVATALQRVDTGDPDAVIDALSTLSRLSLDKESLTILEEELGRKLEEREKRMTRPVARSAAPPTGKRAVHRQLTVILGSCAKAKLWSPTDLNTRPMMGSVRGAVFSMLTSLMHGNGQTAGTLPGGTRWLDLFAGTGAVGIEAVSRGAEAAHFVELDPWVIAHCLTRNLAHTRTAERCAITTGDVMAFLSPPPPAAPPSHLRPFTAVSVCPPYDKVSYPALLAALEASPLVAPGALLVVEYPRAVAHVITETIGRLTRVRDRRYGRTRVAVYEAALEDGTLASDARGVEAYEAAVARDAEEEEEEKEEVEEEEEEEEEE